MFASRIALALGLVIASLPVYRANAWELPRSEDFCDTGWVLKALKANVDSKYRHYNGTKLFLTDIINPQMTYERERDELHKVGRKFCHATVRMNDGSQRDMWYLLESPWGFAGMPKIAGLEFCIAGLDPWHVYGKNCATIRNYVGW